MLGFCDGVSNHGILCQPLRGMYMDLKYEHTDGKRRVEIIIILWIVTMLWKHIIEKWCCLCKTLMFQPNAKGLMNKTQNGQHPPTTMVICGRMTIFSNEGQKPPIKQPLSSCFTILALNLVHHQVELCVCVVCLPPGELEDMNIKVIYKVDAWHNTWGWL